MKIFFSVIIPCYNRILLLKEAINSVLSQSFGNFELIIIDDASTDDTNLFLNSFSSSKTIKTFRNLNNRGVSFSRNRGIKEANGEYIAFLDSDDLWLPEKLQKQYDFFQKNPKIKICHTNEKWLLCGKHLNQKKIHRKVAGFFFERATELCLVSPSTIAIHHSIFMKYGTFDETLPVCEDYDLWLRLNSQLSFGYIDKELIIKRSGHDNQLSKSFAIMDQYRIQSMLKLLSLETLSLDQKKILHSRICEKAKIILKGATKHQNKKMILFCNTILNKYVLN